MTRTSKGSGSYGHIDRSTGYRSKFEGLIAADLQSKGVPFVYEPEPVTYEAPAKTRKYTKDFELPNGIVIEAKGRFTAEDRQKHLLIRQSNPELDIRFVFQRAKQPIKKGSKTTYADWCDRNGFLWAEKLVPVEWTKE